MGADQFITTADGNDVGEAFRAAVEAARWENGHGGYTGTVAEKDSYVVIGEPVATRAEAEQVANDLLNNRDARVTDKWGPAGAIQYGYTSWVFFGLASS